MTASSEENTVSSTQKPSAASPSNESRNTATGSSGNMAVTAGSREADNPVDTTTRLSATEGHANGAPENGTQEPAPPPESDWRVPPHLAHDDPLLACLTDIVRMVGSPCSPQALSGGLPLVDNRLVPSLLPRAAARAGCTARMARRKLHELPDGLLPAMLLLNGQRACVLLSVDRDTCQVQYPETGTPVTVQTRTLESDYTGLVCFVHPQFKFDKRASGSTNNRGTGHWFWRAVFSNGALYRDAIIAAGLLNVFALAMPLFSMNVYDRVVPNNAVETLWAMVIGISLVILFDLLLSVVRSHVVDTASKRIDVDLSARIMEQVMDIRMANKPGSVGSFAANLRSFESIRDFIASASLTTLVDIPFVFIFLGVLGWISPYMLLPPLVGIITITIISLVAQFRLKKLVSESFQASSQRNGVLVESLGSLETIKTLNAQGHAQRNWESSTKFLAQVGSRTKLATTLTVNAVQAIQKLVTVSIVVIGVYLAQNAELTVGGIIASSMIAGRCIGPFTKVASLLMQYQNAKTSLGSIDGYMKLPVEHPVEKEFVSRPVFNGEIEFRNVTFAYPGTRQPVLRNISFKLKAGEKVGVIGRIGSGKTTLEKLILGLYAPNEGAVLIDGIDVNQIDPSDLRRVVGHIPQDPVLFYGTLKHNLTLGAPFATDADILAIARVSGIDEFADQHPDGYDMMIGERGDSLSGGQRQSIAVARGLINDPPIVLLDEPSSNMDNQSEASLKARLKEACSNKTILLVTHRTALLALVDRLIVMDRGKIVADGPKDQVVEALRNGRVGRAGGREA